MNQDILVELLNDMLWISILLVMPPLAVALTVGLLIGFIQAITSIQEQTLSFVPKILAIVLVFMFFGTWMLRALVDYSGELFASLPQIGAM